MAAAGVREEEVPRRRIGVQFVRWIVAKV